MYDIAIIGAGPAGATLARLVGRDYRVLLLEKRRLVSPAARAADEKCCGGLIAPDAQKALAAMGLALPVGVLVGPQIFAVRTIDLQTGLERFYQRHYINVDRAAFDRWLVSLIPLGVDLREQCAFRRYAREGGGFVITFACGRQTYEERARILIGADGARSPVRRQAAGGRRMPQTYVAIQEWFAAYRPLPYFSAILDSSITDFYCWTVPKGDCLIVGAALAPGRDATAKFNALKDKLQRMGFDLRRPVRRAAAMLLRPQRLGQLCMAADGVALVGEAAGCISPSSAEGISYALRCAAAAAEAMRGGETSFLARYLSAARPLKMDILLRNLKSRFIYSPTVRKLLMQSGWRSIDVRAAAPSRSEHSNILKNVRMSAAPAGGRAAGAARSPS